MKRIIIVLIALVVSVNLYSQRVETHSEFMIVIKENNPSLKALEFTLEAQKQSNRIGNTPSDPSISVNPGFKGGGLNYSADISFLFPTIYYQTKQKARMATAKNEYEYYVSMFQELQNIDQSYITAVYTNKKIALLAKAYAGSESIKRFLIKKVKEGKSSILDLNTAKAELLSTFSDVAEAKLEYQNVHIELNAINGGIPIEVSTLVYPEYTIGSLDSFVERAMKQNFVVKATTADSLLGVQNMKLAKSSWAPNISLGYTYNTTVNKPATNYGEITAGISVPLWQNSHKIRASKLEYSAMIQNNKKVRLALFSTLEQLRNSYIMAFDNHLMHQEFISSSSNIDLLRKSLSQGKLSIIDYYTEVNRIIDIELQKLEYEYRVVATMAEMQSLLH